MTAEPVVHRHAPSWKGLRTAAIGNGAFPSLDAGAAFFGEACRTLEREGFEAVVGPMDGNTWGKYRLATWSDGSPAFAMEPGADDLMLRAYFAAGFSVAETHVSANAAPGTRGWGRLVGEVGIESWDGSESRGLLEEAYDLTMIGFANTPFFTPIPREVFVAAYDPLLVRADPRFILRARDRQGKVVGLTLAFPDPYRKGAIVLKTYVATVPGVGRMMADRIHELAGELGFAEVVHALMRRGIVSRNQSAKFGGKVFREYALMGKAL